LVHFGIFSNGYTPEVLKSSAASLKKTPLTFSSNIHRINQITDYVERQDYALNLFDNMDDVDMDPADYYNMMTNVDAHAI
jgi:hypothetical protein